MRKTQWIFTSFLALFGSVHVIPAFSAPLALSHVDVFQNLQPNVLFMVDDSLSIDGEIMTSGQWTLGSYLTGLPTRQMSGDGLYNSTRLPDGCSGMQSFVYLFNNQDSLWKRDCFDESVYEVSAVVDADWRLFSHHFNSIYYNPKVTYNPWPGYDNAQFNRVRSHPDPSQKGHQQLQNLGSIGFRFTVWDDTAGWTGNQPSDNNANQIPNNTVDLWDNFIEYQVNNDSITVTQYKFAPKAGDICDANAGKNLNQYVTCFQGNAISSSWGNQFGRTLAQEQQNIANWYQYHRRRSFAIRNLVAQLVSQFPDFRYGLDFSQNYNNEFIEIPTSETDLITHNTNLVRTLLEYEQAIASTPLATALDRAGQYFQGQLDRPSPITQSCQANYTVMLTDGFWNDQSTYNGAAQGDIDGDGALSSNAKTTLADIASFYFQKDLAPNLENNFSLTRTNCPSVPIPSHQHMSTIGVAFGPSGNLQPDANNCWPEPALRSNELWGGNPLGTSGQDRLSRIDDLWHAAYNSSGFFASNADPALLLNELSSIFLAVSQLNSSGSKGTLASSQLDSDNMYVVSRYEVKNNKGTLISYATNPETGLLSSSPSWSTPATGNNFAASKRHLFSFNPAKQEGVYLSTNMSAKSLSPEQLALLFPNLAIADRASNTQTWLDSLLTAPLGATVNSNPTFVGQPSRAKGLQLDEVKKGYTDFQKSQRSNLKRKMVYIGSNSGLLHGYDMNSGEEVFTYLPDALLNSNLPNPQSAYVSKMDGQIVAEDAFFVDQNRWRTVIVAGFRFGGTGYIALDVTNPDRFTGADGAKGVLWEYTNQGSKPVNNPHLGFSYSRPAIGRMANGRWAAVFGNGYNSESGQAVLFALDLENGEPIAVIETGIGPAQDPLGDARPNGMAEPSLVDSNQDGIVDVIYAGDLYGNLFAFDVTDTKPSRWASKFGTAARAIPLYATNGAPITTRPAVLRAPNGKGLMVISATGQDITLPFSQPDNMVVGILDADAPVTSGLQEIKLVSGNNGWSLEATEQDPAAEFTGWRIPLSGPAKGYKITTTPQVELGEITTLLSTSDNDVCEVKTGNSVILKFNPLTGQSLNRGVFLDDELKPITNGDTVVDALVLTNTEVNDFTLAGTATTNVIIGNTASGQQLQISTSLPPDAQGRQRYRRIYD